MVFTFFLSLYLDQVFINKIEIKKIIINVPSYFWELIFKKWQWLKKQFTSIWNELLFFHIITSTKSIFSAHIPYLLCIHPHCFCTCVMTDRSLITHYRTTLEVRTASQDLFRGAEEQRQVLVAAWWFVNWAGRSSICVIVVTGSQIFRPSKGCDSCPHVRIGRKQTIKQE